MSLSAPRRIAPIVLAVDGEIGAGKTTLIHKLREFLEERGHKVAVVSEPVDEWKKIGILQSFYQAPEEVRDHVTYEFQTYTFVTRIKEAIRVKEENPDAEIFILERTILTDRHIFMELQRELVGEMLMKMYDEWWDMWARLMPFKPTHHVYLKPDIEKCMERVQRRHREGEMLVDDDRMTDEEREAAHKKAKGGVSEEYQRMLREAHEAYLEGKHAGRYPNMAALEAPLRVIGGSLADSDFRVDVNDIGEEVLDFLGVNECAQAPSELPSRTEVTVVE